MKRRGPVTTSRDRVDSVRRVARRAGNLALLFLLAFSQRVADSGHSMLEASSLFATATARCLPLGSPPVLRDATHFITVEAANSLAAAWRVLSFSIKAKVYISRRGIMRFSSPTVPVDALSVSSTWQQATFVITLSTSTTTFIEITTIVHWVNRWNGGWSTAIYSDADCRFGTTGILSYFCLSSDCKATRAPSTYHRTVHEQTL